MIDWNLRIYFLFISFLLGAGIGLFHFGGLWWTIRRMAASGKKEYGFLVSFFLRSAISVVLFYLVSGGRWDKILAALAGFLAVRFVMVRKIGAINGRPLSAPEDNIHGYKSDIT